MKKNIYLISYIIFDNGTVTTGNMCSEMYVKNTNILNEIIEEIREKNGDRIRNMSNEELAKTICTQCRHCVFANKDCRNINCQEGIKAYLDSECE